MPRKRRVHGTSSATVIVMAASTRERDRLTVLCSRVTKGARLRHVTLQSRVVRDSLCSSGREEE
jgi:hypothetical protein